MMHLLQRISNPLLSIIAFNIVRGRGQETNNDEICLTPPPFNDPLAVADDKPTIHVIMSITTGDYFTQLIEGIKLQAERIGETGVGIKVSSADGDDVKQAQLVLDAAQDDRAVGILTVDGHADNMCDAISNILKNTEIQVVSFDFDGEPCSSKHILTSQADMDISTLVLDEAIQRQGQNINVGYVNDLNYAPLSKRNSIWEAYKEANNWTQLFFVENAANFTSAETLQQAIGKSILTLKEEEDAVVDFIYAPWDYLSINTVQAIGRTNTIDKTSVYGADINDQDIFIMTNAMENSPWKATAGGNPRAIGASLIRMVAIAVAANGVLADISDLLTEYLIPWGDALQTDADFISETIEIVTDASVSLLSDIGSHIKIPVVLVTQEFLVENDVTNMNDLVASNPELLLPNFMQVCWIDPIVLDDMTAAVEEYDDGQGGGGDEQDDMEEGSPTPVPVTGDRDDDSTSSSSTSLVANASSLVMWLAIVCGAYFSLGFF